MIRTSIDPAKTQLEEIIGGALRGKEVFATTADSGGERVVRLTVTRVEPEIAKRRRAGTAKGLILINRWKSLKSACVDARTA